MEFFGVRQRDLVGIKNAPPIAFGQAGPGAGGQSVPPLRGLPRVIVFGRFSGREGGFTRIVGE